MNRNKRKNTQGNKRRTSGKSLGIIRVMPVNTRRKIPATLTEEQEWQTDVPNIKLSRAFLIFLMLHIVAVAGILLFNMMKGEDLEAAVSTAGDSSERGAEGKEPATKRVNRTAPLGGTSPWLDDSNATTVEIDRAEYRGLRQHVVRSGDSLKTIAAQHLVSPRELAALNKLTEGRTSIIIAHRLSTMRTADKILVFHRGELREGGNHEALMTENGIYARLYRLQYGADAPHNGSTPS